MGDAPFLTAICIGMMINHGKEVHYLYENPPTSGFIHTSSIHSGVAGLDLEILWGPLAVNSWQSEASTVAVPSVFPRPGTVGKGLIWVCLKDVDTMGHPQNNSLHGENEDNMNKPPDFFWDPIFRPSPIFWRAVYDSGYLEVHVNSIVLLSPIPRNPANLGNPGFQAFLGMETLPRPMAVSSGTQTDQVGSSRWAQETFKKFQEYNRI